MHDFPCKLDKTQTSLHNVQGDKSITTGLEVGAMSITVTNSKWLHLEVLSISVFTLSPTGDEQFLDWH